MKVAVAEAIVRSFSVSYAADGTTVSMYDGQVDRRWGRVSIGTLSQSDTKLVDMDEHGYC